VTYPPEAESVEHKLENASQEQLMNVIEHLLVRARKEHPKGTFERDAYEASLGMMFATRGSWFRRFVGRWWKKRHEKRMRMHSRAKRQEYDPPPKAG